MKKKSMKKKTPMDIAQADKKTEERTPTIEKKKRKKKEETNALMSTHYILSKSTFG